MAGLHILVIYLEADSSVWISWLDILVKNFFHYSFFLFVCCREECSVVDLDFVFLLSCILVIPTINNFLSFLSDVSFTEAVVY